MILDKLLAEAVKGGAQSYSQNMEDARRDSLADTLERENLETLRLGDEPIRVGGAEKQQVLAVGIALAVLLVVAVIMIAENNGDREMLLYAMIPLAALFVPVLIGLIYMWVKVGKGGLVIDGDRLIIKRTGKEYTRPDIKEAVYSNRGMLDLYDFWGTRFRRVRYNETNIYELCLWLKKQGIPCRVVRDRDAHEGKMGLISIAVGVLLIIILGSAYRSLGG